MKTAGVFQTKSPEKFFGCFAKNRKGSKPIGEEAVSVDSDGVTSKRNNLASQMSLRGTTGVEHFACGQVGAGHKSNRWDAIATATEESHE